MKETVEARELQKIVNRLCRLYADMKAQGREYELAIVEKIIDDFTYIIIGIDIEEELKAEGGRVISVPRGIHIRNRYRVQKDALPAAVLRVRGYFQEAADEENRDFADALYVILKALSRAAGAFTIYWADVKTGSGYKPELYIEFTETQDE